MNFPEGERDRMPIEHDYVDKGITLRRSNFDLLHRGCWETLYQWIMAAGTSDVNRGAL